MNKWQTEQIALLGAGLMGSSMAEAMLNGGYAINVWNRTQDKCLPLRERGATICSSAEAAIAASDIIFLVISDYASSVAIVENADLEGKAIVQVATGSIEDAVALERLCLDRGASGLIDLRVMTYPAHIGTQYGLLLASGRREVFAQRQGLFESFGKCRFVGESVGAATSVMFAWSVYYQIELAGTLEAISASCTLGVDPKVVFDIVSLLGSDTEGVVARWQAATSQLDLPLDAQFGKVDDYLVAADLVLGATQSLGVALPVLGAVRSKFGDWADQGFGYTDIEGAFEASRK